MFNTNNMIKIKKLRSGDMIFELTPNISRGVAKSLIKSLVKFVYKLFSPIFGFFDQLDERRKLVISSVGLGIGLGLSIIVTQRPDALQAFPVLEYGKLTGSEVSVIKINKLNIYETVKSGNLTNLYDNVLEDDLIHLEGSGFLGQKNPVVIADLGSKNLLKQMEAISIGDEIIVIGKNNGTYKYRVIEIREIEAQYLTNVIDKEENSLIIYKPENLLRTRLFVVVAKPYN
ncbi:MAG: hypothetical protein COZ34_02890 [Candidatus Pacebacteria bacterium CG_4_10_14_3_um_filter_34_15]|nr:hypothetical protein [Candidatus Paceibacterota bacterium]PIX81524.1 MAG: hypothetical protein COZ34_02890 [Candidatus Pacebacteria bacterium CG_4_10_14_3_um_filter_34_15]